MTVLDHMKAAGYDPNAARNADDLRRMRAGTMECESIQLRTFRCRPYQYEGEMLVVEATADVGRRGHRNGSLYGWYAAALPGRMAEQHQGKRNGFFQD